MQATSLSKSCITSWKIIFSERTQIQIQTKSWNYINNVSDLIKWLIYEDHYVLKTDFHEWTHEAACNHHYELWNAKLLQGHLGHLDTTVHIFLNSKQISRSNNQCKAHSWNKFKFNFVGDGMGEGESYFPTHSIEEGLTSYRIAEEHQNNKT